MKWKEITRNHQKWGKTEYVDVETGEVFNKEQLKNLIYAKRTKGKTEKRGLYNVTVYEIKVYGENPRLF